MINSENNKVISSIELEFKPKDLAINPETKRIYITYIRSSSIHVIDISTNKKIGSIDLEESPTGICINPITNIIYASGQFNRDISVINGFTNTIIATIDVSKQPTDIAFNPVTNLIYVVTSFNSGKNSVVIIDGATNNVIDTVEINNGTNFSQIEINPSTNLIYVLNNTVEPENEAGFFDETDIVIATIIEGTNNKIVGNLSLKGKEIPHIQGGIFGRELQQMGIGININTNRIYISSMVWDRHDGIAIEPGIITIIDGLSNKIIDLVDVDSMPLDIDVNLNNNLIYVGDKTSGSLFVIEDNLEFPNTHIPPITPTPTPTSTLNPSPTPSPTTIQPKLFTLECDSDFVTGSTGFRRLVLELGDNESCTLKMKVKNSNQVAVSTKVRTGKTASINVRPRRGTTNENGELEFSINAIQKGINWIAWAIQNEQGEFKFNKDVYHEGLVWGMLVEVK